MDITRLDLWLIFADQAELFRASLTEAPVLFRNSALKES